MACAAKMRSGTSGRWIRLEYGIGQANSHRTATVVWSGLGGQPVARSRVTAAAAVDFRVESEHALAGAWMRGQVTPLLQGRNVKMMAMVRGKGARDEVAEGVERVLWYRAAEQNRAEQSRAGEEAAAGDEMGSNRQLASLLDALLPARNASRQLREDALHTF